LTHIMWAVRVKVRDVDWGTVLKLPRLAVTFKVKMSASLSVDEHDFASERENKYWVQNCDNKDKM